MFYKVGIYNMKLYRYYFFSLVFFNFNFFYSPQSNAEEVIKEIEEVVVTARRRDESLNEVPISITAIDSNKLNQGAFIEATDLDNLAPNITYSLQATNQGSAGVGIRGIGSSNYSILQDPKIAIYVDGAYQSRQQGSLFELWDIDRVEILRGPQGTIFGRNSTAGAIQIFHNQPSFDNFFGKIQFGLGSRSYDERGLILNMPISDKSAFRVSSLTRKQDGYIKNTIDNKLTGSTDILTRRISLKSNPFENLTINMSYESSEQENLRLLGNCNWVAGTYGYSSMPTLGTLYAAVGELDGIIDNCVNNQAGKYASSDNPLENSIYNDRFSVQLDYSTNAGDLTIIRSGTDMDSYSGSWGLALSGVGSHYLDPIDSIYSSKFFSTEFRFSGSTFDGKLQYVIGIYDFEESSASKIDTEQFQGWSPNLSDFGSDCSLFAGLPAGTLSCGEFILGVQAGESSRGRFTADNFSDAFFFETIISLSDSVNLTIGFRDTEDNKNGTGKYTTMPISELFASQLGIDEGSELPFGVTLPATSNVFQCEHKLDENFICNASQDYQKLTPRGILDYTTEQGHLIYTSYSEGYSSGGFNNNSKLEIYEPESSKNIEFGFKGKWDDLYINAAIFKMEYINQQIITAVVEGTVPVLRVVGIQQVDIDGYEIEFGININDYLSISGYTGNLDGNYGEYRLPDGRDLSSNEFDAYGPNSNSGITINLTTPVAIGNLNQSLVISHKGENWQNTSQDPFALADSYKIVNYSANLDLGNSLLVTVYGKNITDELYQVNGFGSADIAGFFTMYYGPPREFGFKISKNF